MTIHVRREKLEHIDENLVDVGEALLSLRYGSIAITVHEDRVVQGQSRSIFAESG